MKLWITCGMFVLTVVTVGNAASSAKDKQKALDKAHYVAYQGQQQTWPTAESSGVSTITTKYGLTIYRNLPARAYEILGIIQVTSDGNIARRVSEAAQAAAADAVLVCPHNAFVQAGITTEPKLTMKDEESNHISALTGFLIRWKLSSK